MRSFDLYIASQEVKDNLHRAKYICKLLVFELYAKIFWKLCQVKIGGDDMASGETKIFRLIKQFCYRHSEAKLKDPFVSFRRAIKNNTFF